MDLIVESFRSLPDKKLVVIGTGPDSDKIKSKASANVEILGYQPTAVLTHYMQRANALIFAAEEDFGLVPLEAQACGTPVIAYGKGGALETVRGLEHKKPTGIFFPEQTTEAICAAITTFEANRSQFTVAHCVENASRFSPQQFRENFTKFVQEKLQDYQTKPQPQEVV